MAAMQAARSMGGDGRCSCSPTLPTSCGSPPPSFTKSAHIAYMMVARAGDTEGSNGIYRTPGVPFGIAAGDFTHDGRTDLVLANPSFANISLFANSTPTGAVPLFPIFASLPTNYSTGSGAIGLAVADLNGDQRADVVVTNQGVGTMTVMHGNAAGGFGFPSTYAVAPRLGRWRSATSTASMAPISPSPTPRARA